MLVLTEDLLDQLLEQIGPYISDIKSVEELLKSYLGTEVADVVTYFESEYMGIEEEWKKTDIRILLNALKKM
jgi:hypothetical protein